MSLTALKLRAARARIARHVLPAREPAALGSIQLRPHQCDAVVRVRALLARDGGALLADEVGRGKTFVALAVARAWSRPLLIIPAALRATWADAMRRAGCAHPTLTHEALSRGEMPACCPSGIVVDESHRFRNAATRRHAALATLASSCPILLLSATPVQNGARDLAAQLSLFLGSGAFRMSERQLSRHVARGSGTGDPELPAIAPPRWVHPYVHDGDVLRAILSLPRPPAPTDAGDAGVLRAIGLVRAWASSRAALRATLTRRRRMAVAMDQCIESGCRPSLRELLAWQTHDGDAVQLAFAPLLVAHDADVAQIALLTRQAAAEREAMGALERVMKCTPDPDGARCRALLDIRREHAGESVLVFSEFASTVRAYFLALRGEPGVGMLTSRGARIASGPIGRDELLALFAPRAQGGRAPPERERMSLLLATDLLSEGVNLQDASVVVHLDLPWNPARLAQRVGRIRRPGGAKLVHSYLLAPPASAKLLLGVEERLRQKLRHAAHAIGTTLPVVPVLTMDATPERAAEAGSAAARGAMLERVSHWARAGSRAQAPGSRPIIAAVFGARGGWLAALSDGRLVAALDDAPPGEGTEVETAVALADGPPRHLRDGEVNAVMESVRAHLRAEALRGDCGMAAAEVPVCMATIRRVAELLRLVPRHARSVLLPRAAQLRKALSRSPSLGAERALEALLRRAPDSVEALDRWMSDAIEVSSRRDARASTADSPAAIVAIIVLEKGET